ncbi:profilin-like [Lineus longissimus]|uniref:profilin-like n=1 Tax=Lineus longissimus TaxID=88925 RepID=UPI002B4D2579
MSWDSYIDNIIAQSKDAIGTSNVDKACIIGLENGAPWTTSANPNNFELVGSEGPNLAQCMKSKNFTPLQSGGIHLGKTKYQFLREEDGKLVLGKRKECGAVTIQSSKTAIVIAHCPEGGQQGNANKAVSAVAEYLESLNM